MPRMALVTLTSQICHQWWHSSLFLPGHRMAYPVRRQWSFLRACCLVCFTAGGIVAGHSQISRGGPPVQTDHRACAAGSI